MSDWIDKLLIAFAIFMCSVVVAFFIYLPSMIRADEDFQKRCHDLGGQRLRKEMTCIRRDSIIEVKP